MREGFGKWSDADGTVYEGKFIFKLVQASSNQTSSMDLGSNGTVQEKDTKGSLLKGIEQKEYYMERMGILLKWADEFSCFLCEYDKKNIINMIH